MEKYDVKVIYDANEYNRHDETQQVALYAESEVQAVEKMKQRLIDEHGPDVEIKMIKVALHTQYYRFYEF